MNDRFRFRAWDKEEKEFYEEIQNLWLGRVRYFTEYLHNEERFVVEQCTGLKDKNGKLIYEGDIVRYTRYARTYEEEYKYTQIIRWELYEFNIKNWEDEKEVIGNIHENPELLEWK